MPIESRIFVPDVPFEFKVGGHYALRRHVMFIRQLIANENQTEFALLDRFGNIQRPFIPKDQMLSILAAEYTYVPDPTPHFADLRASGMMDMPEDGENVTRIFH